MAAVGRALVFAMGQRCAGGRLLGLNWAALPEEEPPPEANFRACSLGGPRGAAAPGAACSG